ncbi:hypothetical protein HU751_022955 [Pseudomonas sp. BW13M1]|uniref:Uncharacterized protein n=1 Tax=Pseudomonas peradeniyensis TaxID=2745488 RepID=A0A923K0Y9_9PSED|nr:hypothetical protein [Pseudomonas peradeniyensis]MBV4507694.1 hypothetical protein [Pseudomonas peradeniyensis]
MAKVTNTHSKTPIGLPDGSVVPPGGTVDVPQWVDYSNRQNLAFYVEAGVLVVEGGEPVELSKEELIAKLKALGIEAGKNSSLKTLQERLAEAEEKAKADIIAKLTEKGVAVGEGVTLEELQAELAKHQ